MVNEKYFKCYECGISKPESVMQKYDCSICGRRKCIMHSWIGEDLNCSKCGQMELCNDCLVFERCCSQTL